MPRLEVLDKYLEQGSEVERTQLTALLQRVHTGNRAAVKEINKIARSQSGCASWEAVCATWLKAHGGELALNLRGADSIMLRMKREIEDPSPFVAEVQDDGADIDWSDPAFQRPPTEARDVEAAPALLKKPLRGAALLNRFLVTLGDMMFELASPDEGEEAEPPVAMHADVRIGVYELMQRILGETNKTEALLMLQGLVTATMRGESPTVMLAQVRDRPDAELQPLYVAFVGKPAYFDAMGFELSAPAGTINKLPEGAMAVEARPSLDDWSDEELRALLKVRGAARRSRPASPAGEPGDPKNPDEGGGAT